jgi:hypothetical protein
MKYYLIVFGTFLFASADSFAIQNCTGSGLSQFLCCVRNPNAIGCKADTTSIKSLSIDDLNRGISNQKALGLSAEQVKSFKKEKESRQSGHK